MSYYRKFKIVIGPPLWRVYLRWAYEKCIDDLSKLNFVPEFNRKNFTCLLCGVGNETTADEFIKFVIAKNKKAEIIIVDIGGEQIEAVKKLIHNKYLFFNIQIKQINALELTKLLRHHSIDWIETDGFLEYFDTNKLNTLLDIWRKILKLDGFITIRETASNSFTGRIVDHIRVWIAKVWLGVTIYIHTKIKLEKMFHNNQLKFVSGPTWLPTFRRYSLIKKERNAKR